MNGLEQPWEELNHRSYFLPELEWVEHDDFRMTLSESVGHPVVPLGTHGIYVEWNIVNLSPTISIKISRNPRKIENVYIVSYCSPNDIKA